MPNAPTLSRITVVLPASPTGERCVGCHAVSYFAPGYLFTNADTGVKCFTVARRTEHEPFCEGEDFEVVPTT